MSSFSGLSIALSALYSQRRGLDVTGQNIANSNTEGYSRQRVDLQSVGGPITPAMWSTWRGGGAGVTVSDIQRLQDAFLEARGRTEHMQGAYLDDQSRVQAAIEQVFGEPSDTGLQSQLATFWASWHDVSNRPGDAAAREQLLQQGATVADTLRDTDTALRSLWTSTREQYDNLVSETNRAAASVAELNTAIVRMTQSGLPTADLADQRDLLTMRLAELTGATASPRENGAVDIFLAGSALVSGSSFRQLQTAGAGRLADQSVDPVRLQWADTGSAASAPSGQIASALYTLGTAVPDTVTRLDQVAATLASTVNTQHALGFDLTGAAGLPFYSGTTAEMISVAITDYRQIAASAVAGQDLNGDNADTMAGLASATDDLYRQLVVDVGVATQNAERRAEIQTVITRSVDDARSAESGVNLDEEMTNMLQYQRAYEAAAKVVTSIDTLFDSLLQMVR